MPIKSILTYVDGSQGDDRRLACATAAANRYEAHATIVAFGMLPEIVAEPYAGMAPVALDAGMQARAVEDADGLARTVSERAKADGIRHDAVAVVTTPSMLAGSFGARARFADLVILAGIETKAGNINQRAAFEGALLEGDAGVLICAQETSFRFNRAMIAWDGGDTALHAVRRAYPLISEAQEIEIVTMDASDWQAASAEELAVMLSRHGLSASIYNAQSLELTVAEALARRQVETGCDLAILGGYAHSRFREAVFGGVTRELPAKSRVPLFMAH